MGRKYGGREREIVKDTYRKTGSTRKAADAVGASQTWAWKVCKKAGLIEDNPTYTTRDVEEARRLYVDEKMSCRQVAEAMGPDGPSDQWVYEQMERLGVIRSKSQTNRIWQARENGIDYSEEEDRAYFLYTQRKWSTRRIAKHLEASRSQIMRWLRADGVLRSVSEGTLTSYWEAETPEVRARWKRALDVFRMHTARGFTYEEIHERTGYAISTIQMYVEAMRNGGPVLKSRRRESRYRGVHWGRRRKKWIAEITIDGERRHLGGFNDAREAARAYDEAAAEHGLYDRLNFSLHA